MQRSRVRNVAVGVAVLGVLVADIAVLPHQTHLAAQREATKKRLAYLEAVRAPIAQAFVALHPLLDASLQQSSASLAGIDYPVRDVLAHSSGVATFTAAATAFDKIAVPKDMKAKAAAMSAALHALANDTRGFTSLADTSGEALADAFTTGAFANLTQDAGNLNESLAAAYAPDGRTQPGPPTSVPPSHDSWLFAVDDACLVGENALATRTDSENETDAQYEHDLSISISAAKTVLASIRKVPLGKGDMQAASLRTRLAVADRAVAAQEGMLATFTAGNEAGYDAAVSANAAILPDFAALGAAFGAYGASRCAPFFGVAKDDSSGSSGGGKAT